jgi:uncharacterized membrane protein
VGSKEYIPIVLLKDKQIILEEVMPKYYVLRITGERLHDLVGKVWKFTGASSSLN